jgi:hypothetical protein
MLSSDLDTSVRDAVGQQEGPPAAGLPVSRVVFAAPLVGWRRRLRLLYVPIG